MKNKIPKYDFLIVGSGLIGSLLAVALIRKKYTVLVIEKNKLDKTKQKDQRTLAVNANSKDFLKNLKIWEKLKLGFEDINEILIRHEGKKDDLVFKDQNEAMGSVIYNKDLHLQLHNELNNKKALISEFSLDLNSLKKNKEILIKNKLYYFKKIVIAGGKNIRSEMGDKYYFNGSNSHKAYVGFFNHLSNHQNTAYEVFTNNGPLAVLPAPNKNNKLSTFIYSTSDTISFKKLQKLLHKYFSQSHGKISLSEKFYSYPISPYLLNPNEYKDNLIFVGDSLRSIHPVAGQGWNLGVKDIQSILSIAETINIDSKKFNEIYYSRRKIESLAYFSFTEIINKVFCSDNSLNNSLAITSLALLNNLRFFKKMFIKIAMGKKKIFI